MRISFDLDDTLICYAEGIPLEPKLPFHLRMFVRDEPLRRGTKNLIAELRNHGHEVWIYTTSHRPAGRLRRWLRLHGIAIHDVVNGPRHDQCFGQGSSPSKRPHAFGIDLHIDDLPGVADEGQFHGFKVCVIDPFDADWANRIFAMVTEIEASKKL